MTQGKNGFGLVLLGTLLLLCAIPLAAVAAAVGGASAWTLLGFVVAEALVVSGYIGLRRSRDGGARGRRSAAPPVDDQPD